MKYREGKLTPGSKPLPPGEYTGQRESSSYKPKRFVYKSTKKTLAENMAKSNS